jgi:hypothetical protein
VNGTGSESATPVDFLEDRGLVGGQVHDAVADGNVERFRFDPRILKALDVACAFSLERECLIHGVKIHLR